MENTDIHAHKNVLACVSPHLMELFSAEESSQYHHSDGIPSYRLNGGLTRLALQICVEYAYTGGLEVPDVLVQEVYMAAWQLRIDTVVRECARHLVEELCPDSCISTRSLPGINKNKLFVGAVDAFIAKEFAAVTQTVNFLQLPCANIDVLYQTKQEMALVTNVSLCRLVLDWTRRQLTDDTFKMRHLLERTHLLYLALDNSLQDCSDLPTGHESESDLVQDYKRLVLKCPVNKAASRKKALAAPVRPRVIIYSRDICEKDGAHVQPDWNVVGSAHVGENTFVALVALDGQLTRLSIQLRLNVPPATPSPSPIHTPDLLAAAAAAQNINGQQPQNGTSNPAAGGAVVASVASAAASVAAQIAAAAAVAVCTATGTSIGSSCSTTSSVHSSDDVRSGSEEEDDSIATNSVVMADENTALFHPEPEMFCEVAPMQGPKCGLGVALWTDGQLLVCGGYDRGECLKCVEAYDPSCNRWTAQRSMLEARGRVQIAVLAGSVYAVGGSNGSTELDTMECLPAGEHKWQKRCRLPLARSNAGVCTLDGRLYCVGGWNGQTGIRQCDVYRADVDKWSPVAPLLVGRYQAGVAAFAGGLWVAGGSDAWNCLSSVERYDPELDQWKTAAPLLTPRRGCGLAAFNGRLYAVGGSDGTHSLCSTEVYDEATQTWLVGPSLTTPRANVACICVGDKLYAVGGFAGKSFLSTLEYLDAQTNEWTTFVPQAGSVRVQERNGEVVATLNGAGVETVQEVEEVLVAAAAAAAAAAVEAAEEAERVADNFNGCNGLQPATSNNVNNGHQHICDDSDVFFSDDDTAQTVTTTPTTTTTLGVKSRSNSVRRNSTLTTIAENGAAPPTKSTAGDEDDQADDSKTTTTTTSTVVASTSS